MHTENTKNTEGMSTTDIAAAIRGDIKALVAAKLLPACKYSIRTAYFSGGSSITVRITKAPFGIVNPARVLAAMADPYERTNEPHYTAEAAALLEVVGEIVNAYNRKDIDIQSDYFNVRFYDSVSFDWQEERDERETIKAGAESLGLVAA